MKKKILLITVTIILAVAIAITVYAYNKNSIDLWSEKEQTTQTDTATLTDSDIVKTTVVPETEPVDTTVQSDTKPIETTAESDFVETTVAPETEPIDTSAQYETKPIETTELSAEEPSDTLTGTFYCTADTFMTGGFLTHPEAIPALTLNNDGSMIWRVYYIGGVVDVPGTYVIEDNKIYIYCALEGTPVYGFMNDGTPYMDDKFMFEIVNQDKLIFYAHPDARRASCYCVYPGDAFVRG